MSNDDDKLSYAKVEAAANEMLANGVEPSHRKIKATVGGNSDKASEYFNTFLRKRSEDINQLTNEIGSSEVGKMIATKLHEVVFSRTKRQTEQIQELQNANDELIEIMHEKEQACVGRINEVEMACDNKLAEMAAKLANAQAQIKQANDAKQDAIDELSQIKSDTKLKIEAAQTEANSLVSAANEQTNKAESETAALREQVKALSVDEATRNLEKVELSDTKDKLAQLLITLSDTKTDLVRHETNNTNYEKEITRINLELDEYKQAAREMPKLNAQLVEAQKQITQLTQSLNHLESERNSLSLALNKKE